VIEKKMSGKKLDQKGVSSLIGAILMVVATIVIAGVVMLMLSGFKAPASGKVVVLNQNRINETAITFTVMRIESAGTDLNSVVMIVPMPRSSDFLVLLQ
jgi:flagellin-like protein